VGMLLRQLRGRVAKASGELEHSLAGGLEAKHDRGVDHILAGGAGMNMARRVGGRGGDVSGELLDEGDGERAGATLARQRARVEARVRTDIADDFRRLRRYEPRSGRGPRQRALETGHGGEESLVGQLAGADLVREKKLEAQ